MLKSLAIASLLSVAFFGVSPVTIAQTQSPPSASQQTRTLDPQEFVRLAYSSASLQEQASKLAAIRETRPEVKSFASGMASYRADLLPKLQAFAKERNLNVPSVKDFEHQVILENLEPLDYLALSRRYAELQVQALAQEIRIYEAGSGGAHEDIKTFAAQVLPALQQYHAEAQKMYEAVKP